MRLRAVSSLRKVFSFVSEKALVSSSKGAYSRPRRASD
jgi:hypothetical protein